MKLNTKRTVLIGFAFMSILAFWQFYDQVIPSLLEYRFGLDTFTTNAVMSADNVLALFMLPLFGALSDRTHTRLGKRTPFVLFGTIAAVALMGVLALFTAKNDLVGFFIALMTLLLVMSTYRSPAVAYMPDVTPKALRSKGNAIINLVGYLGGIFATVMMMILLRSEKTVEGGSFYANDQSFTPIFLVIAAFMLVAVLVMVFTVRENKVVAAAREEMKNDEPDVVTASDAKLPRDVRRSLLFILLSVFLWYTAYNAVTTAFSRYCVEMWQVDLSASSGYLLTATIVAIAAFVPLGWLSGKLGRKKTILVGVVLMTACYASALLVHKPSAIMYLLFGLVGVGWAAININSFPMVVEMSRSGDVGRYTGYYYAFSMAAQVTTPLLSGWLITQMGYQVLFPYAVLFSALAFVTMLFVRHGDSKDTKKASLLENFDAGD